MTLKEILLEMESYGDFTAIIDKHTGYGYDPDDPIISNDPLSFLFYAKPDRDNIKNVCLSNFDKDEYCDCKTHIGKSNKCEVYYTFDIGKKTYGELFVLYFNHSPKIGETDEDLLKHVISNEPKIPEGLRKARLEYKTTVYKF